ncbi:MAG: hypothetical protein M3P12_14495 [Gemmatimonadota bacterium]|nr:hypothetical protein [Gemmatimonadota bacterium]
MPKFSKAPWNVRLGDAVEVVGPSGPVITHSVIEIHPHVPAADLRYVTPTADERLTLQISTGPNLSNPRFEVVADPRTSDWTVAPSGRPRCVPG